MSRRGYYDEKDGFVPYDDAPQEPPRQTNADRIRAMSDEEMANCFLEWVACTDCPVGQAKCRTEWANCTKAALEWLKEEVHDGSN